MERRAEECFPKQSTVKLRAMEPRAGDRVVSSSRVQLISQAKQQSGHQNNQQQTRSTVEGVDHQPTAAGARSNQQPSPARHRRSRATGRTRWGSGSAQQSRNAAAQQRESAAEPPSAQPREQQVNSREKPGRKEARSQCSTDSKQGRSTVENQ